jgi:hypothetical protein
MLIGLDVPTNQQQEPYRCFTAFLERKFGAERLSNLFQTTSLLNSKSGGLFAICYLLFVIALKVRCSK